MKVLLLGAFVCMKFFQCGIPKKNVILSNIPYTALGNVLLIGYINCVLSFQKIYLLLTTFYLIETACIFIALQAE